MHKTLYSQPNGVGMSFTPFIPIVVSAVVFLAAILIYNFKKVEE